MFDSWANPTQPNSIKQWIRFGLTRILRIQKSSANAPFYHPDKFMGPDFSKEIC
jgi:hypothetical protein